MRLNKEELYNADLIMELFEERAAIIEYDGGFSRQDAEEIAADCLGFPNKQSLVAWVADLKEQI